MTAEEWGAVTGDLVLRLEHDDDGVMAFVAYAGSSDWYRLGRVASSLPEPTLAKRCIAHLARDPGRDVHGNPRPTSLEDLPGD